MNQSKLTFCKPKPSKKEIEAFLAGMEHAAKQVSETSRGYQEALKIRREAMELELHKERIFSW